MPIGPVFSDFAEASHFLLETVGEDVIRTIPRFFYKYRGVEKIAEGQPADRALLLAERFSGIAAFAHGLGFCQAVEAICGIEVPQRAKALRTVLAELERLRHHAATITGICNSTALAVATSQAALVEEDLLRLSCEVGASPLSFRIGRARRPGVRPEQGQAQRIMVGVAAAAERLSELCRMLRYSSSFLDRLEEVGIVSTEAAISYGLVGPIARASGVSGDMRKLRPYAAYDGALFLCSRSSMRVTAMRASRLLRRSGAIRRDYSRDPIDLPQVDHAQASPTARGRRARGGRGAIGCGLPLDRIDDNGTIRVTALPRLLFRTGTASISPPRSSRSKTSRSSSPASGCRMPSVIGRYAMANWVLKGLRTGIKSSVYAGVKGAWHIARAPSGCD